LETKERKKTEQKSVQVKERYMNLKTHDIQTDTQRTDRNHTLSSGSVAQREDTDTKTKGTVETQSDKRSSKIRNAHSSLSRH